jgi:hypothetical protein
VYWVNHETSPFRSRTPGCADRGNSQNDFDNAQLSHLVLNPTTGGVLDASTAIASAENYQRFCSNYLATAAEGFDRPLLFTNEESVDWTNTTGKAWPAPIGADTARQGGVVVAFDPATGEQRPIWGMGRHNHENSVAIPGFKKVVLLSGDDTFTNNPSQSQLFAYIAKNADAVWNDSGRLYAFVSEDPAYQRYEDFVPGDTASIRGKFIPVPKLIASGVNPDGSELMAADVPPELGGPYPLPPNDGTWQRDPAGIGIDGPQWVLEKWSQLNGVFRPSASRTSPMTSGRAGERRHRGFRARFDRRRRRRQVDQQAGLRARPRSNNERKATMSILIEGDDRPVKDPQRLHQPDNVGRRSAGCTSRRIRVPASSSHSVGRSGTPPRQRVWRHRLSDGVNSVIADINQSLDETIGYDVDGDPTVVGSGAISAP